MTVPAGGKATVAGHRRPAGRGPRPPRRLGRRHRRGHRHAGDPHLAGADQGGRALRPEHQAASTATASPPPGWVGINLAGDPLGRGPSSSTARRPCACPRASTRSTAYLDVGGEHGGPLRAWPSLVDSRDRADQARRGGARRQQGPPAQTTAPQRTEDRQRKVDLSIIECGDRHGATAARTPSPMTYDDIYVSADGRR